MKRILAVLLCVCLALSAVGCASDPVDITTEPTSATAPSMVIEPTTEPYISPDIIEPMHAIVMPTVTENTLADDGTVIFTRSYQQIKLILNGAESETIIASDLQARMNGVLSGAADIETYAKEDYQLAPEYWSPYFIDVTYTPTRIDRSVISLFANHSSYSGGPHPSLITESVTYDLTTGAVLTLGDILVDGYTGTDLCALIIEALAPMSDDLHYDYETSLQDRFSGDYSNVASWYFSGTGLCFHFSPYDIAPYSSGTIIATIPYEDLNGVLNDQYLPAEPLEATGSMYAELYLPDDSERFSFTADVEIEKDGTQLVLYPDATVTNVRIESGTWYSDGSQYVPVSTVFAADSIGLGNAIVITADLSETAPVLRLVYQSGDQEVSAFIVYDAEGDSILLAHG